MTKHTIEFKRKVILYVEQHLELSQLAVARHFNINNSTIRYWLKHRNAIFKGAKTSNQNTRKRPSNHSSSVKHESEAPPQLELENPQSDDLVLYTISETISDEDYDDDYDDDDYDDDDDETMEDPYEPLGAESTLVNNQNYQRAKNNEKYTTEFKLQVILFADANKSLPVSVMERFFGLDVNYIQRWQSTREKIMNEFAHENDNCNVDRLVANIIKANKKIKIDMNAINRTKFDDVTVREIILCAEQQGNIIASRKYCVCRSKIRLWRKDRDRYFPKKIVSNAQSLGYSKRFDDSTKRSVILYSEDNGISAAARHFKVSCRSVRRWRNDRDKYVTNFDDNDYVETILSSPEITVTDEPEEEEETIFIIEEFD